jgi:hypothetical protein
MSRNIICVVIFIFTIVTISQVLRELSVDTALPGLAIFIQFIFEAKIFVPLTWHDTHFNDISAIISARILFVLSPCC